MDFRTELQHFPSNRKFSLSSKWMAMGSCFAEVMGERLKINKFEILINPFGIIFNPVSLENILVGSANPFPENLVAERNNTFFHYATHSIISAENQETLNSILQNNIKITAKSQKEADCLILTLGTSFAYKHLESDKYVANCHKMPAQLFQKELLTIDKISTSLNNIVENNIKINPKSHIILTVSPVRHIKDSLSLNQVSKSLLRVACHLISEKFSDSVSYFPAYEIMMDDLRDYRFYKSDMIHPSEVAENYIWEKFIETYLDQESQDFIKKWSKLYKAVSHKPFLTNTVEYQNFVKKTLSQLYAIRDFVDVESEIAEFEKNKTQK